MDHELAVKNQAVERYFLKEMSSEEREAFEEHFFVCNLCADDVRATSAFVDNAKSILKERQAWPKPARSWIGWFRPAFAAGALAALCLVVIGYQNISVIPALKAPRSMSQSYPLEGLTRSAGPKLHEGDPLHFQMPWDGAAGQGSVFAELREGTKIVSSGAVDTPAPNQPLDVYFPGKLKPGHYTVVLRASDNGKPGRELMQNDFEVIPQETRTK
jgi:hypothetical protein